MTRAHKFVVIASAILGLAVTALAAYAITTEPVYSWTSASSLVFLTIMLASIALMLKSKMNVFANIAALFGALVVGRLFSTMRFEGTGDVPLASLDPLLVAETGPGIPSVTYAATALIAVLVSSFILIIWRNRQGEAISPIGTSVSTAEWGMTALRVYVGLMFIAHFAGHLFAGPIPFGVFTDYFGSIGLPYPAAFVIFAGLIEFAITIGLAFGFMTRIAAIGAALYLFVSVGLGGHYGVGYIWVLPTGGWEFPALWMFATSIFAFAGGGPVSIDQWLKSRFEAMPPVIRRALA